MTGQIRTAWAHAELWAEAARRIAPIAIMTSVLLLVLAGAGPSAATPPLGPRTVYPPWDLGVRLSSAWVSVDLVAAYLLGAVAVLTGLRATATGWRPSGRAVAWGSLAAVAVLVLVAPFGSADHLSYAAYGRIAAQGGDPYLVSPEHWRGGSDPVVNAAAAPWRDTPSVYGPVATALQAVTSLVGGASVRATVWAGQLLVGACFLLTAWLLDSLVRHDAQRRARVAVLWTLNPLMLGAVVGGAHVDGICTAAATLCLWLGLRSRATAPGARRVALDVLAGMAWAVAAGSKLPYAAVGLALVWGLRREGPRALGSALGAGLVGAVLVLAPAYWWAGPHVLDQAGQAARYVSLATPWTGPVDLVEIIVGHSVRAAIPVAFAVVATLTLCALWPLLGMTRGPEAAEDGPLAKDHMLGEAATALLALAAAYLVAAPYVLPWYDALLWPALALAATTVLDGPLTLRLTALTIAYVPGRVEGVSAGVATVMLDVRRYAAPVVTGGVLLWVLVRGAQRWRARRPDPAGARAALPRS